jgi:transposase
MARQRKTYPAEFKLNAVRMVTEQKLSVAEAARRLGISENLLRLWKKAFLDRGADAFPGHGRLSPADEELHRLRAEVVRLRAERDLLKKAAAYFASPPS